jgi:2-oxoglutarate ferredoxin oxidoreductase subunit alpha
LVKGGGHGDYHSIVLAPVSVQEAVDLTYEAFTLAEKYRTIVIIAADGTIGQMMEPVEMPPLLEHKHPEAGWELTGAEGRERHIITSIGLQPEELEPMNMRLQSKYRQIVASEARYEERQTEDAELLVVAFGTAARVAQSAIKEARAMGIRAGLFRPISLWPFPAQRLAELARRIPDILVVEMNAGQMLEDVKLAAGSDANVKFFGKLGGYVPMPHEVLSQIESFAPIHTLGLPEDVILSHRNGHTVGVRR